MFRKLGRLFIIKTRFEAWFVIYAIALGAVERGRHYFDIYPGWGGMMLAAACTGVVFLAGAKLLDSVRLPEPALVTGTVLGTAGLPARRRAQLTGRNRPRRQQMYPASRSRISRRRD